VSAVAPSLWAGGPALPCGHLCAAAAVVESDPPLPRSRGAAHALLLSSLLSGTRTLPATMLPRRISTRPAVVGPVCARALHVAQSVGRCRAMARYQLRIDQIIPRTQTLSQQKLKNGAHRASTAGTAVRARCGGVRCHGQSPQGPASASKCACPGISPSWCRSDETGADTFRAVRAF
jgi:hypothetical protein